MVTTSVHEKRRQLAFVEDPTERLRLMLVNNLKDDALENLNKMIEAGIYFQDASRGSGIKQIDDGKRSKEQEEPIVCSLDHKACFTLSGIAKFFGWKKKQMADFVIRLLEKAITIHPWNMRKEIESWAGSWETWATYRAYKLYVPAKHPIRPAVERWLLEAWFQEAYFFSYLGDEWDQEWLGQIFEERSLGLHHPYHQEATVNHWSARADALAKKFRELGATKEETKEVFYRWLEHWGPGSLNPDFVLAVANMEIFSWRDERRAKAIQPRLKKALEYVFEGSNLYSPYIVIGLHSAGMKVEGEGRKLYCDRLASVLAEGKIGYAHTVNELIGKALLDRDKPELREVVAQAFDGAVQKGEFGIAAALVQQFGEDACFNADILQARAKKEAKKWKSAHAQLVAERRTQIREAIGIAQAAQKPIRFDYTVPFLTQD
jgi:hypothetical protein